jgi:RNA polymerase sigma-70 factor (ECF subfamily)
MKQPKPMPDERIVALYWSRAESAITETDVKYGTYCRSIASNILYDTQDAEESVNDTYLDAWESMPPHKPTVLSTFLGKITRRIAIDRWRRKHAGKRGGGEMDLVLDELADCIADSDDVETVMDERETARIIREFLDALSVIERRVFLRRYWYMDSIAGIALAFGFSESKITSMLHRIRIRLREKLESEGCL